MLPSFPFPVSLSFEDTGHAVTCCGSSKLGRFQDHRRGAEVWAFGALRPEHSRPQVRSAACCSWLVSASAQPPSLLSSRAQLWLEGDGGGGGDDVDGDDDDC
jgi:hypothetical protein